MSVLIVILIKRLLSAEASLIRKLSSEKCNINALQENEYCGLLRVNIRSCTYICMDEFG